MNKIVLRLDVCGDDWPAEMSTIASNGYCGHSRIWTFVNLRKPLHADYEAAQEQIYNARTVITTDT